MNNKNNKPNIADKSTCNLDHENIFSPNCLKNSTPTVSFKFTSQTSDSNLEREIISCQLTNFDTPDEKTTNQMKYIAVSHLGHEASTPIISSTVSFIQEKTPKPLPDVVQHKMASNCGPDYNLNKITSYNKFTCQYLGEGIDEKGRTIRNPFKTWKGTLPSCDNTIEITDELENDIKEVVYEVAGGYESKMNKNDFLCQIQSIPMM